jgi:hypothetical protein
MFERYTEKARRTIFFGRYEASEFGSPFIETEHLLLALLREDKALVNFLRSHPDMESIREQIEKHMARGKKVSTSLDLPLSHECKRVLAYGAEEAERLNHMHIGTEHLMVGLLREEKCFAAQLLRERGLNLAFVREQVRQLDPPLPPAGSASFVRLEHWLAERQAQGGVYTVKQERVANRTALFAIYKADQPKENDQGQDVPPAEKLAQIQRRIDDIVKRMENAIANHEFEKARFYSDEVRKERENLRLLCEQFHLEEPPPRIPLLCIEIIREQRLSEVQKRCDDYIAEGVTQVWLLDPYVKRAYTVTKAEGLREFRGAVLQIANPPLEMDLRTIFD